MKPNEESPSVLFKSPPGDEWGRFVLACGRASCGSNADEAQICDIGASKVAIESAVPVLPVTSENNGSRADPPLSRSVDDGSVRLNESLVTRRNLLFSSLIKAPT